MIRSELLLLLRILLLIKLRVLASVVEEQFLLLLLLKARGDDGHSWHCGSHCCPLVVLSHLYCPFVFSCVRCVKGVYEVEKEGGECECECVLKKEGEGE